MICELCCSLLFFPSAGERMSREFARHLLTSFSCHGGDGCHLQGWSAYWWIWSVNVTAVWHNSNVISLLSTNSHLTQTCVFTHVDLPVTTVRGSQYTEIVSKEAVMGLGPHVLTKLLPDETADTRWVWKILENIQWQHFGFLLYCVDNYSMVS